MAADNAEAQGGDAVQTPGQSLTLYLATLRREWRLAACIVAACIVGGLVIASLSSKSYDATSKVLIGQRAQLDALLGASGYTPDPERDVNTNLAMITLEPVAESVRRSLGLGASPAELAGKITTEPEGASDVVSITARDSSPAGAARIANAFAVAFRDFRARSAQAAIDDAVQSARARAEALPPGADRDALESRRREIEAAGAFESGGVQIVRRASPGSAVASGGLLSSALLAALLGAVLAGLAIVVIARTDKRVRDEDELERLVGRPVLATVPTAASWQAAEQARDALATVAIRLTLSGTTARGSGKRRGVESARRLLVVSPGAGDGADEVTLGLAQALGELGRSVVAIEADLRQPSFAEQLGVDADPGLSAILAGRWKLEDAIVKLVPTTASGEVVSVLVGGEPCRAPQGLLAGSRMASVITEASGLARTVLISAAPAAASGDALALVRHVDAVLVVARLDRSRRDETARMIRALEEAHAHVIGAVATHGPPREGRGRDLGAAGGGSRVVVRTLHEPKRAEPSANGFHEAGKETPEVKA
jgi:Mrp family chromosome partitioning ATPase